MTRALEEELAKVLPQPKDPRMLAPNVLPTRKDVLLHENYLKQAGLLNDNASYFERAKKLTKDVIAV